jgi:hypothetical protein
MIYTQFIDGLIPFVVGVYVALAGFGVVRMHKDPEKAAANLKKFGTLFKVLGPLVALWGLYQIITSF